MNRAALRTLLSLLGFGGVCGLKLNACSYLSKNVNGTSNTPVIIPGFEKSGTTDLFHLLNSTGCFNTGKKKELKFLSRFCVPMRMQVRKKTKPPYFRYCPGVKKCSQLSDYLQCWSNASVALPLDGTPAYSHTILLHQNKLVSAATELQYLSPSSKSIWLLRNPVERTVSSYYFYRVGTKNAECTLERKVRQEMEFLRGNRFLTLLLLNTPEDITAKKMVLAWARLRRNFRKFGYRKYSKYCPATPEIVIGSLYLPMLVHWVSTLKLARHMILSSEFFFAEPEHIVAKYIEPFVFQSKKLADYKNIEKNIVSMKPANRGKYDRNVDKEIKCILQCFFSPFIANLSAWLLFLQNFDNVQVYPAVDEFEFGWNTAQKCGCALSAPRKRSK